jgi:hypothetical protein
MLHFATIAIDVGSTRTSKKAPHGNLGWIRVDTLPEARIVAAGTEIDRCVTTIASALDDDQQVALGLESPGWLPVPARSEDLCRGRNGEGNRSCFAPAGGFVATLGVAQLGWILRELARQRGRASTLTTRPEAWSSGGLLLWEAFVSGAAHATKNEPQAHLRDAATAAFAFIDSHRGHSLSAVSPRQNEDVFPLFGAVLRWARAAGYAHADDADLMVAPHVVKPATKFEGTLRADAHR